MDILTAMTLRRAIIQRGRGHRARAFRACRGACGARDSIGTRARMVLTRRVSFPLKRNPALLWKYARADAMIAVCRATADSLVASGIESARITVAYSGVDLTRMIPPASPETLASLGVKSAHRWWSWSLRSSATRIRSRSCAPWTPRVASFQTCRR